MRSPLKIYSSGNLLFFLFLLICFFLNIFFSTVLTRTGKIVYLPDWEPTKEWRGKLNLLRIKKTTAMSGRARDPRFLLLFPVAQVQVHLVDQEAREEASPLQQSPPTRTTRDRTRVQTGYSYSCSSTRLNLLPSCGGSHGSTTSACHHQKRVLQLHQTGAGAGCLLPSSLTLNQANLG